MITHLPTTGSTNDWLMAQADARDGGARDGDWVRADTQTGGRGRRGRAWTSIPGNLFASVLVRPQPGEGAAQQLSFVAAVALDRALQRWVAPARLAIKWPNDVLLDGVKVAGILLERHDDATIVGFGVNLAGHPTDSERPATSFAAAGAAVPTAAEFLDVLAAAFAERRRTWRGGGFAPVRAEWLERAAGRGGRIEARLGTTTLTGIFEGLAADGALELRLDDGTIRPVHAGEVFSL